MKITMNNNTNLSNLLEQFLNEKQGTISPSTYKNYKKDITYLIGRLGDKPIEELTQKELDSLIPSLDMAPSSRKHYSLVLRTFINWCDCGLTAKEYKCQAPPKETYTEEELKKLLKKPNLRTCTFTEYKTWVMETLLLNCGCRASTLRNIRIQDIDFNSNLIFYYHTKNKNSQAVPIGQQMESILKEYLGYRGEGEWLFPTENNTQMSEWALRSCVVRYNHSRGVERTSIHAFRHTFAKYYLLEMGGDAFTLQHILGHSTLEMTRHYCQIYNADIVKNFQSPLGIFADSRTISRHL